MSQPSFQVFECTNPGCRLRFSTDLSVDSFDHCPACKSAMQKIGIPYSNYQPPEKKIAPQKQEIFLVLDNLRSTLNVGSIFRTADGAGVKHIYCCGTTPTPDHPKIKKTSLGAESTKNWSYEPNAVLLVQKLKASGGSLVALEIAERSISLFNSTSLKSLDNPVILVIGNEISGVDPGILSIADHVLSIPMIGSKTSLNVAVSAGIAIYMLAFQIDHYSSNNNKKG